MPLRQSTGHCWTAPMWAHLIIRTCRCFPSLSANLKVKAKWFGAIGSSLERILSINAKGKSNNVDQQAASGTSLEAQTASLQNSPDIFLVRPFYSVRWVATDIESYHHLAGFSAIQTGPARPVQPSGPKLVRTVDNARTLFAVAGRC